MHTNKEKIQSWAWRRAKAKLSQRKLAELVGKRAPEICKYEKGDVQPAANTIDDIESVLNDHGAPLA